LQSRFRVWKGSAVAKINNIYRDIEGAEVVHELNLVTIFLDNNRAVSVRPKQQDQPESLLKSFHGKKII